jgi:hypothetical protein
MEQAVMTGPLMYRQIVQRELKVNVVLRLSGYPLIIFYNGKPSLTDRDFAKVILEVSAKTAKFLAMEKFDEGNFCREALYFEHTERSLGVRISELAKNFLIAKGKSRKLSHRLAEAISK